MPGSMRQRGENTWRLEVTIGTDFRGKPNRYSKTFHGTKKQAEKELARYYTECEAGNVNKSAPTTIQQLSAVYLKEYVERNLKKSAMRGINPALNKWINPVIGSRKVTKLTRLDVQRWVNYLEDGGPEETHLSAKTIHNYYFILRSMMNFAVEMDIIPENPCKNIRLPDKQRKEANYYTLEDVQKLLIALDTVPEDKLVYKVAICIALFGGLRCGEIMGLNWEDVNFDTGEISICRTRMVSVEGGIYEDTPKTKKSIRTVVLPAEIIDLLSDLSIQQKEMQLLLGNKYHASPAVMRGQYGKPLYPQMLNIWFKKFQAEHDLNPIRMHGLRHTHASMLANMGTDKMQISKRLGHSQLSTTLNIYTHLFEQADQNIAESLSSQFLKAK